jgi:hypothetical protein
MRRRRFRALALRFALLLATSNAAAEAGDSGADFDPGKARRRSDFAFGANFGAAFGTASGYPNDAAKIGVDRYHASTGAGGGMTTTLWLGGALSDWIVVGIGFSGATFAGSGTLSQGGGFVAHVEGFPLFYRGGAFRDLALVGDFGLGRRTIQRASETVADGGAVSFLALGLLWEPIRMGKHFNGGPILQVTEQFSDAIQATLVTAGFQVAYYAGPG